MELYANLLQRLRATHHDLNLQLQLNPDGLPKRGAFEVSIAKKPTANVSERIVLWSGLHRSPRAKKFPPMDELVKDVLRALDLPNEETLNDDDEDVVETIEKKAATPPAKKAFGPAKRTKK